MKVGHEKCIYLQRSQRGAESGYSQCIRNRLIGGFLAEERLLVVILHGLYLNHGMP